MKARARFVLALTASSFFLSACLDAVPGLSSEDPNLLSAEERQIRQIETQRRTQSTLVGCGVGLLAGMFVGNDDNREQNVLLGTAVGCAVGFAAGSYINARTAQLASQQADSRALIQAADQDIARYRSLNATTRNLVAQQRAKVAQLNRQLASGQISAEGYRTRIASAERNVRTLDNQSKAIGDQIDVMKSDAAAVRSNGGNAAPFNQRIARLEREKRELDSQRRSLARIYGSVPPAVNLTL